MEINMTTADENEAGPLAKAIIAWLALPGGVVVVTPAVEGMDWRRIMADDKQDLSITNRPSEAYRMCSAGRPAIAVMGISEAKLRKWLRKRGANVQSKTNAH
jgi:hypothetical protein